MDLASKIRKYIKSHGMTYTFVCKRANINIKKFSRLMTNRQKMTTDEFEQICRDGLRVDPGIFFKDDFLDSQNETA